MGLFGKKKTDTTDPNVAPEPLSEFYTALEEHAYQKLIPLIQALNPADKFVALYTLVKDVTDRTISTMTDDKLYYEKAPESDGKNTELEKVLLHFAINDDEATIRHTAAGGIQEHELLYQLALLSPGYDDVDKELFRKRKIFTNVAELENLVLNAKYSGIKHEAVGELSDQPALERIARNESVDSATRIYAYRKLTDPDVKAELKSLDV